MDSIIRPFKGTLEPETILLAGSFLLNGASAPSDLKGDISAASRTSEGLFAVTFKGNGGFPQRIVGAAWLEGDVAPGLEASLGSVDVATRIATVRVKTAGERATGTLTTPAKASLLDTDLFTILDGVNPPLIYELDVAGDGAAAGNVAVNISGATTAADVATLIAASMAINTPLFTVVDNLDGTLDFTHKLAGAVGNQTLTETVANAGFLITGMAGGEDAGVQDIATASAIRVNVQLWIRNLSVNP